MLCGLPAPVFPPASIWSHEHLTVRDPYLVSAGEVRRSFLGRRLQSFQIFNELVGGIISAPV